MAPTRALSDNTGFRIAGQERSSRKSSQPEAFTTIPCSIRMYWMDLVYNLMIGVTLSCGIQLRVDTVAMPHLK